MRGQCGQFACKYVPLRSTPRHSAPHPTRVAQQVEDKNKVAAPDTEQNHDEQQHESETPHGASHLSAHQVFEGVAKNARRELERPTKGLAFSGLAGGMSMGLTGLGVAIMPAT